MTRIVSHAKDSRVGIAIGPHAEAIYDGAVTHINGIAVQAPPPVELQRETVCWWIPGRRCWSPPEAVYSVELLTFRGKNPRCPGEDGHRPQIRQLRDMIDKLIADKGLRVGSDDNLSTWYAVNRVLGIEAR